jgi:hypothetical protein
MIVDELTPSIPDCRHNCIFMADAVMDMIRNGKIAADGFCLYATLIRLCGEDCSADFTCLATIRSISKNIHVSTLRTLTLLTQLESTGLISIQEQSSVSVPGTQPSVPRFILKVLNLSQ